MEPYRLAISKWAPWALQNKISCKHNIHNGQTTADNQPNNNNNNGPNNKNIYIVAPYIHGLGHRFKRKYNSLDI